MHLIVISQFHPAAAAHQPRLWATMREDWEHLPTRVDHDFVISEYWEHERETIALDTESAPDGGLGVWSIAYRAIPSGQLIVVPFYGRQSGNWMPEPHRVVMHHAKHDIRVLQRAGMSVPANIVDSMIAAYCLCYGKTDSAGDKKNEDRMIGGLGLKYLARRHLGMTMDTWNEVKDKPDQISEYNAKDSVSTLLLWEKFEPELPEHFWKIDMPLLPVIMAMEDRGMAIDPAFLGRFAEELDQQIKGIELPLNPFSVKQLREYVYGKLQIEPFKWTDGGEPSVDSTVLETLDDPVIKKVLEYKSLYREHGTYIENYIEKVRDGRIHSEFKQTSTATGRLSSVSPNLQNVPTAEHSEMRKLFVAPQGFKLVRVDWSQIELRVLAVIAGEEKMLEAFEAGRSIHQETADLTGLSYSVAKNTNFAMVYDASAWELANQFGIPIDEAKRLMHLYFRLFPGLRVYHNTIREQARTEKEVTNYFGRRRKIDAMLADDWRVQRQGEKEAINFPIQSAAGEIVKLTMIALGQEPMILQVHDELLFEVPAEQAVDYAAWLKDYIPKLTDIKGYRFPVEVSIGDNWYQCCKEKNVAV